MLIAALAFAGCNNNKQKEEEAKEASENVIEENKLPNRLLIIVDPQIDFTTGSLATKNGPAAMDYLAKALDQGAWKNYGWIIVTQDAHPANHCSFVEQGGVFPPHCVQGTEGMNVYKDLQKVLDGLMGNGSNIQVHFMEKGDLADKEEFSIFQNAHSGEKLRRTIEEFEHCEGIESAASLPTTASMRPPKTSSPSIPPRRCASSPTASPPSMRTIPSLPT